MHRKRIIYLIYIRPYNINITSYTPCPLHVQSKVVLSKAPSYRKSLFLECLIGMLFIRKWYFSSSFQPFQHKRCGTDRWWRQSPFPSTGMKVIYSHSYQWQRNMRMFFIAGVDMLWHNAIRSWWLECFAIALDSSISPMLSWDSNPSFPDYCMHKELTINITLTKSFIT